jgi:hypothetical protein
MRGSRKAIYEVLLTRLSDSSPIGRGSGQAADAFQLLKMFVKGKGAFQFERSHDGEACAVGETEILVGVSFEDSKSCVLNRRANGDNFNKLSSSGSPEKNGDGCKSALR